MVGTAAVLIMCSTRPPDEVTVCKAGWDVKQQDVHSNGDKGTLNPLQHGNISCACSLMHDYEQHAGLPRHPDNNTAGQSHCRKDMNTACP